ncbi:exported hypothetical protein [Leuconostoc carnosum]|nr:hypothetical protein [Leuconostoc carnosum]SPJ43613.1 exported hypothetical protein [Leuconostoc carnosum]SPO33881.1 exported hypothetical protein [Leuconostoc carnosum]
MSAKRNAVVAMAISGGLVVALFLYSKDNTSQV